jgi:hypothetical protein
MAKRRRASELSYDNLLNEVLLNSELAKESGQHAPALTGLKMLGNELFRAFTDRKEIINLDIRAKSKSELKAIMVEELGEDVAEIVWQSWNRPRQIEASATELEPVQEPDSEGDIGLHGEPVATQNVPLKRAVEPDTPRASAPRHDMERLALESLANSKPPEV